MRTKKLTIKLLNDTLLITKVVPDTTPGGLYIPESARGDDNVHEGEVLACGPGRWLPGGTLVESPYAVGDRILYGADRGLDVTVEGQKVRCLTMGDVLGVFPRKKETVN